MDNKEKETKKEETIWEPPYDIEANCLIGGEDPSTLSYDIAANCTL